VMRLSGVGVSVSTTGNAICCDFFSPFSSSRKKSPSLVFAVCSFRAVTFGGVRDSPLFYLQSNG